MYICSIQKKRKIEASQNGSSSTSLGASGASCLEASSSATDTSSTTTSSEEDRDSPPVEKRPKIDHKDEEASVKPNAPTKKKLTVAQRQSQFQSSSEGASSKLRSGSSVAAVTKRTTKVVESTFKPAAEDGSARKVYKSLFNSSASQRPKERTSNWVTYNPYF